MRLIDADVLLREIEKLEVKQNGDRKFTFKEVMEWCLKEVFPKEIADVPTVEAVPTVHGRWQKFEYDIGEDLEGCYFYMCKQCGCTKPFNKSAYCPYCGAKMDEEDDYEETND